MLFSVPSVTTLNEYQTWQGGNAACGDYNDTGNKKALKIKPLFATPTLVHIKYRWPLSPKQHRVNTKGELQLVVLTCIQVKKKKKKKNLN